MVKMFRNFENINGLTLTFGKGQSNNKEEAMKSVRTAVAVAYSLTAVFSLTLSFTLFLLFLS
ncbi:hypothetical protein [Thermodesulfovibrio yellowstonii]|uniref:hypothetical protein n=1 Tax=Thermodesulfovibrio yellowstonii TaxID=28262 RepID=UPI0003F8C529|nr:hypothetical protein [Thermodesulfovibrio islandicus]